jgi:hypothetical protein
MGGKRKLVLSALKQPLADISHKAQSTQAQQKGIKVKTI